MTLEKEKEVGNKSDNLHQYLTEEKRSRLGDFLSYGEKIKSEGERKKKEFWKNHKREDFLKLLEYSRVHKEEMESQYEILSNMKRIEREKYIDEYLYDDILYNGELREKIKGNIYSYKDLQQGKVEMTEGVSLILWNEEIGELGVKLISRIGLKRGVILELRGNNIGDAGVQWISKIKLEEGVKLNLGNNNIGAYGAQAISKMKLKKGVHLGLSNNSIGDKGAEAISKMELEYGVKLELNSNTIGVGGAEAISKMELKDGVQLNLSYNEIGTRGTKAIAENLKLKEGVELNLCHVGMGNIGAQAIMHNLQLKDGVMLDLRGNGISDEIKEKLKVRAESKQKKGIHCEVLV